jgi:tetratricopeptide (TPR) repeat protein
MRQFLYYIIIFLFSLVLIKPLSAQNMSADLKKARELSNAGNYTDAIALFEKWLPAIRNNFEKDQDYISLINQLGKCYVSNNQPDSAVEIFMETADLSKKLYGEISPEYATRLEALASLYVTKGEYEKAEFNYLRILEIRKQKTGEEQVDYANSLQNLGDLYFAEENFEKAESSYLKVLEIRKKLWENLIDIMHLY